MISLCVSQPDISYKRNGDSLEYDRAFDQVRSLLEVSICRSVNTPFLQYRFVLLLPYKHLL